jgi:hypothetical protein
MATISNTPRPGYVWDSADNVWYPIGVGAHQHTNAADTPAVMPYSTYAAAGKNKIINGDFGFNQRAFTSTTTDTAYGFDRFKLVSSAGGTMSAQTFTPGTAPVSGYEAINFCRIVTTGQSGAGVYSMLEQDIEDVRTFAGQTATISFWAKAASGTPKIAVEIFQQFGSGGSPSATVETYVAQVTLSTSWARYTTTIAVPSISGKTIGTTANTSFLGIRLWVSAGSSSNSVTGSLGIQSNTFDMWGVQVEAGSNATAFQTATGTIQGELAACQRYYFRYGGNATYEQFGNGQAWTTTNSAIQIKSPVSMRVNPTSVDYSTLYIGIYGAAGGGAVTSLTQLQGSRDVHLVQANVASGFTANQFYVMQANNSTSAYIGFSAEL